MNRIPLVSCLLTALLCASCVPAEEDALLPKASFDVAVLTTSDEFGLPYRFNARGQVLTQGPAHHLAIIDVHTRTVTTVSRTGRPVGFNDDGEVLYQESGPYLFRHADGTVEQLPIRITGHGEFLPFALGPDGAVWGTMYEEIEGQMATPGFGMYRKGVVSNFRPRGIRGEFKPTGHDPVNAAGQAVFCKAGSASDGNGLPTFECYISQSDGSQTDLNPVYTGAYRVRPLGINARGELAGGLEYGLSGLGGSRAFLYEPPTGYLLGEGAGDALSLNDAGDVIYTQLATRQLVQLRKAGGEKFDLTDYLRNPDYPEAEVKPQNVLAMNAAGLILINQAVAGSTAVNVALLTPR